MHDTQKGHVKQALNCFEEMQHDGILRNAVTYTCILKTCATIKVDDKGKQIHDEIARQWLLQDNIAFSGCWNALVASYAQEGRG